MEQVLRLSLVFVLVFFGNQSGMAQQTVTKESAIEYLNQKLKSTDRLELKGKFLMVKTFRGGEPIKEDKINIYDLNPKSVSFQPNESLVVAKCLGDADGCVERKTIKVGRKSYRNRVTFMVTSKEDGQNIAKALNHLIMLHAVKDYEGTISLK